MVTILCTVSCMYEIHSAKDPDLPRKIFWIGMECSKARVQCYVRTVLYSTALQGKTVRTSSRSLRLTLRSSSLRNAQSILVDAFTVPFRAGWTIRPKDSTMVKAGRVVHRSTPLFSCFLLALALESKSTAFSFSISSRPSSFSTPETRPHRIMRVEQRSPIGKLRLVPFSERSTCLDASQSQSPSSSSSGDSESFEMDALEPLTTRAQTIKLASTESQKNEQVPLETTDTAAEPLRFRWAVNELLVSVVLGILTGYTVAIFKLSIDVMRRGSYSLPFLAQTPELMAFIPAFGGLMVGIIALLGVMPPGLRGQVAEIENESAGAAITVRQRLTTQLNSWKKSAASVFTLGTGCSLGPEVRALG